MYQGEKNKQTKQDARIPVYLKISLRRSFLLVFLLLLLGILGYALFFDHSLGDAIFMTIITVATVGYGEVVPLTVAGKYFTSVLILLSLFVFGYALATMSAYLVSNYSYVNNKKKKMQQKIDALRDHVLVCGYGRNGREAVTTLRRYGKPVVVIESNPDAIDHLHESGILYLEANATDDAALERAGVSRASHLISTLPSDSDNVFIALSARQLNPSIRLCSRANEESNVKKLKVAGVDHVIMPDKIGGTHLATLVVSPDLVEFIGNLSSNASGAMLVQEILLKDHPGIKRLDDLRIKEQTGCTVIGYKSEEGAYIVNPDLSIPVHPRGRIIVLGNTVQLEKLRNVF